MTYVDALHFCQYVTTPDTSHAFYSRVTQLAAINVSTKGRTEVQNARQADPIN